MQYVGFEVPGYPAQAFCGHVIEQLPLYKARDEHNNVRHSGMVGPYVEYIWKHLHRNSPAAEPRGDVAAVGAYHHNVVTGTHSLQHTDERFVASSGKCCGVQYIDHVHGKSRNVG